MLFALVEFIALYCYICFGIVCIPSIDYIRLESRGPTPSTCTPPLGDDLNELHRRWSSRRNNDTIPQLYLLLFSPSRLINYVLK